MQKIGETRSLKEMYNQTLKELNKSLEIKHERGVEYSSDGNRKSQEDIFIRFYKPFVLNGWLKKLRGAELSVFMAVAFYMDFRRISYPSIDQLARDTGYKRDAVMTALKGLERKGLINRDKRRTNSGKYKQNLYTVLPDWIKGVEKSQ
jgi:hypothetical protein